MANGNNFKIGNVGLVPPVTNEASNQTLLYRASTTTFTKAFSVWNTRGDGIGATGTGGIGVSGWSDSSWGVSGYSNSLAGVFGTGKTAGVSGYSQAIGVSGMSQGSANSIGVKGESNLGIGVHGIGGSVGVQGESGPSHGVLGQTGTAGMHSGVIGIAPDSFGVSGGSNLIGVRGVTYSVSDQTGAGVLGYAQRGNAVAGITVSGTAGYFEGKVIVIGDFTVAKGAKSAAVPHPDGSYRRLYSLESPESFFEDFGRARLARGKAFVELDRDFAALVRRDDYHVFLTAEGEGRGLYVSRKGSTGFEVREQQGGDGTASFSYRVVARRKDIDGARLEKVRLPSLSREQVGVIPEMALLRPRRRPRTTRKVTLESRAAAALRANPRPGARGRARR
jgi:hypothetical protein